MADLEGFQEAYERYVAEMARAPFMSRLSVGASLERGQNPINNDFKKGESKCLTVTNS